MLDNAISCSLKNTNMRIPFLSVFLFSGIISSCQVHWGDANDWTLYQYQGHRLFKISVDSLKSFNSRPLNLDSVTSYLSSADILRPKAPVSWMGGYLVTCKLNGEVRKIEFSNYGTFFFDEKYKTYYQLSANNAEAWNACLQNQYLSLVRGK